MNLGKRKKYYLDRVVHSQSETIDRRWGAGVGSVGRSFRQEASSHIPECVEISVAWVVGCIHHAYSELLWLKLICILAIPFFRYGTRDQQITGYFRVTN